MLSHWRLGFQYINAEGYTDMQSVFKTTPFYFLESFFLSLLYVKNKKVGVIEKISVNKPNFMIWNIKT